MQLSKIAFWNNPLVVSALRIRFRRTGTAGLISTYMLLLAGLGGLLHYYQEKVIAELKYEWTHLYLISILGIQAALSAIMPMFAVSASMQREVATRTWDFQRITALRPHQILVGKLLGDGSFAYMALISTIPFAVWCLSFGAARPLDLVVVYLNLVTTTIWFGSIGLLHPLDAEAGKGAEGSGQSKGGVRPLIIFLVIVLPYTLTGLGNFIGKPFLEPIIGLFTPIFAIYGIRSGDVFSLEWSVFGWQLPYTLVAPIAQISCAALIFHVMRRRIVYLQNTALRKPVAYGALAVFDLLLVGMLWDQIQPGTSSQIAFCSFWTAHFLASLAGMIWITPFRATLLSWVWRYRAKTNRAWDLWAGERTENVLALVTFWLIGVVFSFSMIVLPAYNVPNADYATLLSLEVPLAATIGLCLLLGGTLFQWLALLVGKSAVWGFALVAIVVGLTPHLGALYYHEIGQENVAVILLSLAPAAHLVHWFDVAWDVLDTRLPRPRLVYLWGTYLVALGAIWLLLRRQMSYYARSVDSKLALMGVGPIGHARGRNASRADGKVTEDSGSESAKP